MKTFIVKEFGEYAASDADCMDLSQLEIKNCIGCWTCWWKTPGKCIYRDMEHFYRGYINAENVVLFVKPQYGFVSSKLKTLFDRMIPLFIPNTYCDKGCTWHYPRYLRYPNIEIYYQDDFASEAERKTFCDYLYRVFEQFHSKEIQIKNVSEFKGDF